VNRIEVESHQLWPIMRYQIICYKIPIDNASQSSWLPGRQLKPGTFECETGKLIIHIRC